MCNLLEAEVLLFWQGNATGNAWVPAVLCWHTLKHVYKKTWQPMTPVMTWASYRYRCVFRKHKDLYLHFYTVNMLAWGWVSLKEHKYLNNHCYLNIRSQLHKFRQVKSWICLLGKSPVEVKAKTWVTGPEALSTGHMKLFCVKYIELKVKGHVTKTSFLTYLQAKGCYTRNTKIYHF